MNLVKAARLADEVIGKISPFCRRIEVAGSVRRLKREVNDIDIVLIPSDPWGLDKALGALGARVVGGGKLSRFLLPNGVQVDLYFADEDTWATLLLIRTGSKESNIRLCMRAQKLGMKLKANGVGVIGRDGNLIPIHSEKEIYDALGLDYQEPWERG